jgi:hypothetical protein
VKCAQRCGDGAGGGKRMIVQLLHTGGEGSITTAITVKEMGSEVETKETCSLRKL